MNFIRKDNASGLVGIRMDYLLEDFPEMSAEQAEHIRAGLPKYYAEHLERDFFAYTAEEGGKAVGSAFLVVKEMPPNSNFPNGRIGDVLNVYVRPEYRRQGIAKALMEMLISDAKAMELDYIELKASAEGYPLYKKLGFEDSVSSFRPMKLIL